MDRGDETAVVIGGTTGIGEAISKRLAADGATVIPTSRTESSVAAAAAAVGCDLVQPTDVTKEDEVETLFDRVAETYGNINVLVNCAGVPNEQKPPTQLTRDEWYTVNETNLLGPFLAAKHVYEHMGGDNRAIVNISSIFAIAPMPGYSIYNASKRGVEGLTESLAIDYADAGIRVNAVAPGYVKTRVNRKELEHEKAKESIHRRTPMSRYGKREEIANMVAFLSSAEASFITGQTIAVDGGFSISNL